MSSSAPAPASAPAATTPVAAAAEATADSSSSLGNAAAIAVAVAASTSSNSVAHMDPLNRPVAPPALNPPSLAAAAGAGRVQPPFAPAQPEKARNDQKNHNNTNKKKPKSKPKAAPAAAFGHATSDRADRDTELLRDGKKQQQDNSGCGCLGLFSRNNPKKAKSHRATGMELDDSSRAPYTQMSQGDEGEPKRDKSKKSGCSIM